MNKLLEAWWKKKERAGQLAQGRTKKGIVIAGIQKVGHAKKKTKYCKQAQGALALSLGFAVGWSRDADKE